MLLTLQHQVGAVFVLCSSWTINELLLTSTILNLDVKVLHLRAQVHLVLLGVLRRLALHLNNLKELRAQVRLDVRIIITVHRLLLLSNRWLALLNGWTLELLLWSRRLLRPLLVWINHVSNCLHGVNTSGVRELVGCKLLQSILAIDAQERVVSHLNKLLWVDDDVVFCCGSILMSSVGADLYLLSPVRLRRCARELIWAVKHPWVLNRVDLRRHLQPHLLGLLYFLCRYPVNWLRGCRLLSLRLRLLNVSFKQLVRLPKYFLGALHFLFNRWMVVPRILRRRKFQTHLHADGLFEAHLVLGRSLYCMCHGKLLVLHLSQTLLYMLLRRVILWHIQRISLIVFRRQTSSLGLHFLFWFNFEI